MKSTMTLAAMVLLTSCQSQRVIFVPSEFADCPPVTAIPQPPKPPRTVESIAKWGQELQADLIAANSARNICAERLKGLNAWIGENDK